MHIKVKGNHCLVEACNKKELLDGHWSLLWPLSNQRLFPITGGLRSATKWKCGPATVPEVTHFDGTSSVKSLSHEACKPTAVWGKEEDKRKIKVKGRYRMTLRERAFLSQSHHLCCFHFLSLPLVACHRRRYHNFSAMSKFKRASFLLFLASVLSFFVLDAIQR